MSERLRSAVPGMSQAAKCKPSGMQHRVCRVQSRMQRCKTASITNCDGVAFAGRADRNTFADARRNTEYNSVPNTDGTHAHTITPVTLRSITAETSSQTHFGCSFSFKMTAQGTLSVCLRILRMIGFRALAASRIRKLSLKATFTRRFSKRTSAASLKQGSILRQGS